MPSYHTKPFIDPDNDPVSPSAEKLYCPVSSISDRLEMIREERNMSRAAFAKSIEKYDWSGNAYGLQSHMLGNNGNGITHEIWVAFANQQAALAFLDGMYASKEFAEYIPKANALSVFKRSYMEVSLNMFNPD